VIRYGILGMASISPRFIKGIESSEGSRVEAIYSSKGPYDSLVTHYNRAEDLYRDPNIDIIYIPSPNYLHKEHIEKALLSGKHVVCEKPLVLRSDEARYLYDLALSKELFLMEGQKIVFLPATLWLKEAIELGTFGKLNAVRMQMWFAPGDDKTHWMYDDEKGGGVLYGSANYPIEYMMYLLGTTDLKHRSLKLVKGINNVDEKADFEFDIRDVGVSVTISRLDQLENYAEFIFENATIKIPNFWKTHGVYINGEEKHFETGNEFKYEVDHIKACLDMKLLTSPAITPMMSIKCIEYVERIKKGS
jgi:predicted dehydrogenase